jgi:uncharacterized protein YkwD
MIYHMPNKSLFFSLLITLSASQLATANGINGTDFKRDDGTYAVHPVTSSEDCTALCAADTKCRGSVTYQADITKPEMECRLNDGFGENPLFPSIPPEPLDLSVALVELNIYRAEYGLQPLRLNEKLNKASELHAKDLAQAGIISHTGTDGSGHGDRVQRQGYYFTIAAENVATGQKSWDDVFQGWKDSPGHNENLLRDDVTDFGIALVYEPKTTYSTYWAMLVASPMDEAYWPISDTN